MTKTSIRHSGVLALITVLSLLLPLSKASAQSMGGLKVGDTFELKVARVTSTMQEGISGAPKNTAVPKYIPRLRKNQKIKFRIRAGGKLTAPGINLPFAHFKAGVAEFDSYGTGSRSIGRNAEIKVRKRTGVGGTLSFFITETTGSGPVYRTVIYKLVRP